MKCFGGSSCYDPGVREFFFSVYLSVCKLNGICVHEAYLSEEVLSWLWHRHLVLSSSVFNRIFLCTTEHSQVSLSSEVMHTA